MEDSLSFICLLLIIKMRSQAWAANELGVDEPKFSKILKESLSLGSIDKEVRHAFMSNHAGVAVLLGPVSARQAELISATGDGNLALAQLAERALRHPNGNVGEAFTDHRIAAMGYLRHGASYEYDEESKTGKVVVADGYVDKAEMHFQALRDLNLSGYISAAARPVIKLGATVNLNAIEMLREKSRGRIQIASKALAGYEKALTEATELYNSTTWPAPDADGTISSCQSALRLIIVSCGAAMAELAIEAAQPAKAREVFERVNRIFHGDYSKHLRIVFVHDAWNHNQAAMAAALNGV